MAIDLSPAVRAVEGLMTDTLALYRNPGGPDDDVLNPNPDSLELADPTGPIDPYYVGVGIIRLVAGGSAVDASNANVPLAVDVRTDDALEVRASRDIGVVGRWFRVSGVLGGTFAVAHQLQIAETAAPSWAAP